jgi:hypothetical protein
VSNKFYAEGTGVRFADGKPCCVTSHSIHLDINPDPNIGYAEKAWDKREGMASIIAEALNQYFANRQNPSPETKKLGDVE